jgi:hypothetical protein
MPTGLASPIVRVPAGYLNRVADPVVGMNAAPLGPGLSKFAAQLGQAVVLGSNEIVYDSAIGTLYSGMYQYVRIKSTDTAPVIGQQVFWDLSVAENLYQVTVAEATYGLLVAGVVINGGSYPCIAGNYSWICVSGKCNVQFRATLTAAGAIGSAVFQAAAGAGADQGFADVISTATLATTPALIERYLGVAEVAPTNGGLKTVWLSNTRRRY